MTTDASTRTPISAVARRRARRGVVQHLIAADESSLGELQALLATLPVCATGRVFVEVPDASWIGALAAPGRMTVTWLDRSARSGEPGSGRACARGQALTRAVSAWADEMMCAPGDATRVFLLGGYLGTAQIVEHLAERLGRAPGSVHAPQCYGLGTR
ncbi:SIP domain-containing protein [Microbacterium luticocti]|uniref:SIP domain-containing protein n=1 Tax=Microbacterium luticocti TaxID=451764 RepID=UPI00041A0C0B|nr:SIP domain-containing protein [Microbacterium luticocti]